MINTALTNPSSIAIVGASNNLGKPGGGLVHNLVQGGYKGRVYPVNVNETIIQGLKAYQSIEELPPTDLAILAIPAATCVQTVKGMAENKATKAFIIISAGFAEMGAEGKALEQELKNLAQQHQLDIIGPNCIGVMNSQYKAVFVSPPPAIKPRGVDFVSASGALAVFLFENAPKQGLEFGNVFTVGNSAVIGVEEVLAYWDHAYDPLTSSNLKMVYVEQIRKPELFYKHIHSLRSKGCDVIVAKPGDSEAGARAALSHTGALAGDSAAFGLLIKKAGAIPCYSRQDLINTACILSHKKPNGNNLAIITHAGGPAVLITDRLQKAGIQVPEIDSESQKKILSILHRGASAINPVDLLATANKEQLTATIEILDSLSYIDALIVIYGKTGMEDLFETYSALSAAIDRAKKPVYSVLPSVQSGEEEITHFLKTGKTCFIDEYVFAEAFDKVLHAPKIYPAHLYIPPAKELKKQTTSRALSEEETLECLKWAGIPLTVTELIDCEADLDKCSKMEFPLVAKVMGILHKTEVNGVILNITNKQQLKESFEKLLRIPGSTGMVVQEMIRGTELYLGAKRHDGVGFSVHAGSGGIFLELLRDVVSFLAPVSFDEAYDLLGELKSFKLFEGYRNMPPVNREAFAQVISAFSRMFEKYQDIKEIDLNPLIASGDQIVAVDARIII
ncbi:MAG: acetate--CoA ligase family protein [Bacteroidota bacterium]|nr:MAG: acetate--CoA ligase family protein [Bacteroidota bacterium]